MRRYNENILKATKKLSSNTMQKSKNTVKRLTNPDNNIQKLGSRIGLGAGVGLLLLGSVFMLLGKNWGLWTWIVGAATILSNVTRLNRSKFN